VVNFDAFYFAGEEVYTGPVAKNWLYTVCWDIDGAYFTGGLKQGRKKDNSFPKKNSVGPSLVFEK